MANIIIQTLTLKKKPVRPRLRDEHTVKINNINIPYKQSITYLGYTLSYNLKPKKHIDKISHTKSQAIVFSRKSTANLEKLKLNDENINYAPLAKYLGITFDKNLTWNNQIQEFKRKFAERYSRINPLFITMKIPLTTKINLYKAYIRSVITYAAPAWMGSSKLKMQKIQVLQNRCLRKIGGYDRYTRIQQLHEDLRVERIEDFVKRLAKKMYDKAGRSRNSTIRTIGDYNPEDFPRRRMPKALLGP